MRLPRISRRKFLQGAVLAGTAATCPGLLSGCSIARSCRTPLPDVSEVSLQQKIAQMLIVGFRAMELKGDEPIVRDIRDLGIGGVILFDWDDILKTYDRDIASPQQVVRLTTTLNSYARLPLLISIDQEGGKVCRLKERYGFPSTVSAQTLGSSSDLSRTRIFAESTASTLRLEGINLNFAPVVDLNVNPANPVIGRLERSFSADPAVVTAHAREVILAHRRHGVLTCVKHFPGHGSSTADSHKGFTDVTDTWSEQELEPYRTLISEGNCPMVMTAHIYNRKLDPEYPATLSYPTITGLLRNKLGYDGVVVSDDMQMGAIAQHYSFDTAIEKAILAGVDILDICNEAFYDPDTAPKTIELVTTLVRKGVIPEGRIDESYRRISRLKRQMQEG